MADGSIRIETKLDNSALKQQIKELERELKNIQKEKAKTDAQVSQTSAKYDAEREFDAQFPEEFSHRQDIDERAAKELDPILAQQEELNQKEQKYLAMLDAAKAKLTEQANVMSASKQVDDTVKADSVMGKVQSQAEYNSLLDVTAAKMAAIEAAASAVAAQTGLSKEQILAANPAYQKLSDTMGMLKSKAKDFGDEAQVAGKKTKAAMKEAEASARKVGTATKHGIAGFGRMQLGMMGLMFAMRAISAATNEYMAVNSQLEGQMNTLRALWGQVLGPVIQWVVNLLIQAVSAVNAFIYALSGINLVAKANAAALKKQTTAAGGAAKAAKQNQLAGFDEQTKLSDTSGGGGGGGGGGAVATLPDGTTMDLSFLDPLMEAIAKFKEDIAPLIETVGNLFKWLWAEVLVPFGDWALNSLLPAFLNLLGGAFLVINEVLLALQPMALWLWENFLQPIAEWTGGVIVDTINWLADALRRVSDWISENQVLVQDIVIVITSFATAWALVTVAMKLWTAAVAIWNNLGVISAAVTTAFGAAVQFLTSPINLVILAIGALIAIVILLVKHWDEVKAAASKCWEGIKGIWAKVSAWFNDSVVKPVANFFVGMWDKLKSGANAAWEGIKSVFSVVTTWFSDTFSKAWNKVKDIFSTGGKIFDGIKDGIANTFKTIVNGIISGINRIIATPFNSINSILNRIRNISVLGMTPFAGMWGYSPLSVPQIPKLAHGGIVNRPGRGVPAIIGEAGAEAVLPLENNTEWMDILADKIGGGTVTIPITLDGKRIATYIVDIQKKKAFATNGA